MIRYLILIVVVLLLPTDVQAQTMETFKQLPFWDKTGSASYIEALYKLAISLAAVLVVLRLIWAGVQYMLSEMVTSKQKAKETIQSALLGLLIILGAVTILNTINPRLTNLDVIGSGPTVAVSGGEVKPFRVNLKVGDVLSVGEISAGCSGILVLSRMATPCYTKSLDYYKRSCIANGGGRFEKTNDFVLSPDAVKYACLEAW